MVDNLKCSVLKGKLRSLLVKYKQIFSRHSYDIGKNDLFKYKVVIDPNVPPPQPKSFNLPLAMQDVLQKHIAALLKAGVIRPGRSEFCSPVFLIGKAKNGEIAPKHKWNLDNSRIIWDMRGINKMIKDSAWPMPLIKNVLQKLSSKNKYSILDMKHAYYNVELHKDSQKYFAFNSPEGKMYTFTKCPQGSNISPRAFCQWASILFDTETFGNIVTLYIDDICVASRGDDNEHLADLEKVFERLLQNNVKLGMNKCQFFTERLELLGHEVTPAGIAPLKNKLDAIKAIQPPRDIAELRSFLGLTNWYRSFYLNYAKLSAPLTKLLRKESKWSWGKDEQESFDSLKMEISNPNSVFLSFPDLSENASFWIAVDTSGDACGGLLLQIDDTGRFRLVSTFSKVLSRQLKWITCHVSSSEWYNL